MSIYMEVGKEIEEKVSAHIQKGENIKLINIEYNDKLYRQIQFRRKAFGKGNYILKGIIYLSQTNDIVKDTSLLYELEKLAFHYKNIFDRDSGLAIISTYEDKGTINRYEEDFSKSIEALNSLKEEVTFDIEIIKRVIEKVIRLRKEKNNKLEELIKLEEKLKSKNYIFDEELFIKSYSIFEDVLKINFKSINCIYSIMDVYDELNKECSKKKRSIVVRFNGKMKDKFMKLDYVLSYFKKVINTYNNILNLNENNYIKLIRNKHKEIIKENLNGLRQ
ncbi:hypothetical protein CTM_08396 [Clostridium tetanomorphum DSM 665]|nr:hypothetical protein [Clostridium tetanomorphum]KAJ52292.1 hypothetical protein CTM_08396 [Clostridium tetanomorphum DSM 665]NRZ96177.1 hypothetical protein [Clostridium tetanomorphum]